MGRRDERWSDWPGYSVTYYTAPGTGVLVFNVFADRNGVRLDRQAVVKLVRLADQYTTWQTTEDTSRSVFSNLNFGSYEVEVSAVGYFSVRQELQVMGSLGPIQLEIVLRHDPTAANLDVAHTIMSPKARKEAKHAESLLKSGSLDVAQKHLDAAYKLAPSSSEVNFLLGYIHFQRKDFGNAGKYLDTAAKLSPTNGQAWALLGRTRLEQEEYSQARSALEQAVLIEPDNWLPHQLLATAYFREKSYDKASSEAQFAMARAQRVGIGFVAPAQLVLGESLIGLGRDKEGIEALNEFLKQAPRHPMAAQVRSLIAEIQQRTSASAPAQVVPPVVTAVPAVDLLSALPAPVISAEEWRPPSIDDMRPALSIGVTCPTGIVIDEAGKRVRELVQDLARFVAVEDLFHQALDRFGNPIRTVVREYNYVASLSEQKTGAVFINEYRSNKLGAGDYPDGIASTGFAIFALVFDPEMRQDFDVECEGLTDWHGQATWLVNFRQRADRRNRMHAYQIGANVFPVDLRGRAWISADKFQIMRMEADLVKPIPEIQLLSEHQIVEYEPVPFLKKNTTLWLPKQAEIYFNLRKHSYYRRHTFDHYMLFSVDAEEKRKEPTVEPSTQTAR